MSNRYVIRSVDDSSLLWSNDEGFTESDNFEVFSYEETEDLDLPIGGEWIELITY